MGRFAILFPWLYLRSTQYGHLDQDVKKAWLKRLLIKFDQANYENLEDLRQRYLDLSDQISAAVMMFNCCGLSY